MSASPSISVIIPVYNAEKFIEEALLCVFQQTLLPDEVVVIDDGSTDSSAQIIKKFPTIYQYQSPQGPGAARNAGLTIAKGEIIAFLDADDLWPTDMLQNHIKAFRQNPAWEIVMGNIRLQLWCEDKTGGRFVDWQQVLVSPSLDSLTVRAEVFKK
ncbi:MAG: glycosyltransferase family 2 protein [Methylococcales bacterium]